LFPIAAAKPKPKLLTPQDKAVVKPLFRNPTAPVVSNKRKADDVLGPAVVVPKRPCDHDAITSVPPPPMREKRKADEDLHSAAGPKQRWAGEDTIEEC
jgi:hypothetical protein